MASVIITLRCKDLFGYTYSILVSNIYTMLKFVSYNCNCIMFLAVNFVLTSHVIYAVNRKTIKDESKRICLLDFLS